MQSSSEFYFFNSEDDCTVEKRLVLKTSKETFLGIFKINNYFVTCIDSMEGLKMLTEPGKHEVVTYLRGISPDFVTQ